MASHGTSLSHLCQCFRGVLPKDIDWISVISLANQTLTTPALQDVASISVTTFPKTSAATSARYSHATWFATIVSCASSRRPGGAQHARHHAHPPEGQRDAGNVASHQDGTPAYH